MHAGALYSQRNNVITINLKGGLGNQMFQYACGRALSLRNGDELRIVAEGLGKANAVGDIYRPFSLQKFAIAGEVVPGSSISFLQKVFRKINQKVLRNFNVGFEPSILEKKGDVFLDGYFQSEKYFADAASSIRADFALQAPLCDDALEASTMILQDRNAVSLHVRRGDYATHTDFGGIADTAYYERAIARMLKEVPNAHFYVFSDDIAWCKENLPIPADSVFVSKPEMNDYEELHLMSLCKHNIIANSSFSWWGAWLNNNPNKTVVAPTRWAHGGLEKNFKDIVPEGWIRI